MTSEDQITMAAMALGMNVSDLKEKLKQEDDRLITVKETGEILSVSRCTIWRYVQAGTLKPIYLGSSPRFKASDINKLVAGGF